MDIYIYGYIYMDIYIYVDIHIYGYIYMDIYIWIIFMHVIACVDCIELKVTKPAKRKTTRYY